MDNRAMMQRYIAAVLTLILGAGLSLGSFWAWNHHPGTYSWPSLALLAGGLVASALIAGLLAASGQQAARSERLVVERTRELRAKITDHARSEAALSQALNEKAVLAAAVANTTAGVLITDARQPDHPIVFVNQAFTAATGYAAAAVHGRPAGFLAGPDTDAAALRLLRQAVAQGQPLRGELLCYRRDGTSYWVDLILTPVRDAEGLLTHFVGILNDISEQRHATLALQYERDRLQRQLAFANALASAAEAVLTEADDRALLTRLTGVVGQALSVDRARMFDVDLDRRQAIGLCEWFAEATPDAPSTLAAYSIERFARSAVLLAETRAWFESHDDAVHPALQAAGADALVHGQLKNRSLLAFPFRFRSGGYYLMTFGQLRFRRTWKEDEIAFLEAVSKLASVALEKLELLARHGRAEAEARASAASFRTLIEQSPEGIFLSDLDGNYVEVNPAACALVGYRHDELLRMNVRDLLNPEELPALEERLRAFREGRTLFGERRLRRRDGTLVAVESIAKPLPDGRLLAIMRDLTERSRSERSLREAKQAAELASQAKSAFLANMSHEIRTPMNGVLGMLGLLLETPLEPEMREFAETARLSGEHLLNIINDILDFSKIEAARLELESIVFDLPALVEETVSLFAEQAHGKGLELVCVVDPDVPPSLRGDPSRLRQVLINLLGNAVKFTGNGAVIVRVGRARRWGAPTPISSVAPRTAARNHEDDQAFAASDDLRSDLSGAHPLDQRPPAAAPVANRAPPAARPEPEDMEPHGEAVVRLLFQVTDTGPGIPPEARPRLFQAFYQGDSSTTRRYGGTGLGLAISQRLVQLMGGTIDLTSEPNGTTFHFTLALAQPAGSETHPLAPEHLRGVHVLVVDDHPASREALGARLRAWGMHCDAATAPAQALSLLREDRFAGATCAIALVDLDLTGASGLDLIRTIHADPDLAAIHLVAMTTLTRRGAIQEARRLGASACLTKPVRSVQLLDTLLAAVTKEEVQTSTGRLAAKTRFSGRVLVAEDNLVNRRLALAQLSHLGVRADAVANGHEALDALARTPYDLILMDGQMPEVNGYAATAEIRRREGTERHTRIAAMTADALAGDRERCLAAGMDDYLAKPVKLGDLHALLQRWLKSTPAEGADTAKTVIGTATTAPATGAVTAGGPAETGLWETRATAKAGRTEARATERTRAGTGLASRLEPVGPISARYRKVAKTEDGLDPAVVEDLLSQGGPALLSSLVEDFRLEAPATLAALDQAIERGDQTAAAASIHRLKGSAWSLGLHDLAAACLALEHAFSAGLADTDRRRLALSQEYERGLAALDEVIKRATPG
jgi:PAS domain S-box-containing protein